jgi:Zn-dependent peptidase ImmA (M78 family)/transcriptional regulator with XRE-family HTH domain
MARLLGVSEDHVVAWEGGEPPGPQELDLFARLVGLELDEFLEDGVGESNPVRLLFRYARESFDHHSAFEARAFLPSESALPLGDFVRHARRLQRLEALLGWPTQQDRLEEIKPAALPRVEEATYERAAQQGQELAESARRAWGMGDEPISSVSAFLERDLGVPILVLPASALPKSIEAAAARVSMAAILLRSPDTSQEVTRVRMTLAHELCHLLHDRGELDAKHASGGFFSFTPTGRGAGLALKPSLWRHHFQRLERIEARARSFAACFLAPLSGVRALIGGERHDTPEAIYRVREHFGVSREVAINQLCNASLRPYSAEWRKAGRELRALPGSQPWAVPQESWGDTLLHPRLRAAIVAAAQGGKLSLSDAWGYAGRRLGEPLASPRETQDPRLLRPLFAPEPSA